jgi:hypothetical protein
MAATVAIDTTRAEPSLDDGIVLREDDKPEAGEAA